MPDSTPARQDIGTRSAEKDIPTLVRDLIASFPKDPGNTPHFEAWDHIRGFSLKQVQEALQIAGEPLGNNPENLVASMLLNRWGELEPEAALGSLAGRRHDNKEGLVMNLVGAWIQRDPDAAIRWAQAHPEEIEMARIHRMRAATILGQPPAAALAEARQLPPEVRQHVVGMLAQTMMESEQDRTRCFELLAGMAESDRLHAAETMVKTMTRRSAREALDLLETLPMSEEARQRAMTSTVTSYARQMPGEAIEWLASQSGIGGKELRGSTFNDWGSQNAAAADAWLEKQAEPASILAAALEAANLKMLSSNVETTSRTLQGERMRSYYLRWQALEPEPAARWLEKLPSDVSEFIIPELHDE
ncbi:hypothetical protein [Haloferula sp. BvORR071]|uniref:hypothetical protein n=1 Tax=Haloferula sp. BvORR071 TaxID=1396141 RepID=UPI0005599F34|nr:hypothetical protein [Haloferula sp. BvORR071]